MKHTAPKAGQLKLCEAMERAAKEYSTNKNVKTHEVDDK